MSNSESITIVLSAKEARALQDVLDDNDPTGEAASLIQDRLDAAIADRIHYAIQAEARIRELGVRS